MLSAIILWAFLVSMVAPTVNLKKESPGEIRERDRDFRKDRRKRVMENRGPVVDENGNVHAPRGFRWGWYPFLLFTVRRVWKIIVRKFYLWSEPQKWLHERYRFQIRIMEHSRVAGTIVVGILLLIFVALFYVNPLAPLALLIIPVVLAPVEPKEVLSTGVVSAEDWAEISGNHTDVEIQAALDYAKLHGKSAVHLGTATWTFTDEVQLTWMADGSNWAGIHIYGANVRQCIIQSNINDAAKYTIRVYYNDPPVRRVENVYISDVTFSGDATSKGAIYAEGVGASSYYGGMWLERVDVRNYTYGTSRGVTYQKIFWGGIYDCTFRSCGYGLYMLRCNDFTVSNCRFLACAGGTQTTDGCYRVKFFGSMFEDNTSFGARMYITSVSVFDSCYCENNGDWHIRIQEVTDPTFITTSNVITRSYFDGDSNTEDGLQISAPYTTVTENYFRGHNTCSIEVAGIAGADGECEWNYFERNTSIDVTYMTIGSADTAKHTVVMDREYIGQITDSGLYTIWPDMTYKILINHAGGNLTYGDVVIHSTAFDRSVRMTSTGNNSLVAGVIYDDTTADGLPVCVLQTGQTARVKVNGVVNIGIGDFLATYTAAGIAQKGTVGGGNCFAIALEAYTNDDSNGLIKAILVTVR